MKIYRGPRTSKRVKPTDSKALVELVEDWHPNTIFRLDGTIDKSGERHSDIGVKIEPEDIVTLFNALIRHYKSENERLNRENTYLRKQYHAYLKAKMYRRNAGKKSQDA